MTVPLVNADDVRPTVGDVALIERTRCRSDAGEEFDTFNDDTSPTYDEVCSLIDLAVIEVLGQLPDAIDPALYPAVTRLIVLRTSILVELSFFRVQATEGPMAALTAMFLSDLKSLAALPVRLV